MHTDTIMEVLSARYRLIILAVLAASAPFVYWGAEKAREGSSNRIEDWAPAQLEETKQILWFLDHFDSDELLMVSWEGCTLSDPRLPRFVELLRKPVRHADGHTAPWFQEVFSGDDVLESLISGPSRLSTAQAKRRMRGWLMSPDEETTCAVALASPEGRRDREAAVAYVFACADRVAGLTASDLHVAGPTLDTVAIDQTSEKYLMTMSGICLLLVLLVTYLCLRSIVLALMVFAVSAYSQQLGSAIIYLCGSHMDSVMLMVPTLVFVLSISAGIHLVNYYGDAVSETGLGGAARKGLGIAWQPCTLAAVTTALGLVSLALSQLKPVQRFGVFGSLGVLCGLVILLLSMPALLEQFPPRRWAAYRRQGHVAPNPIWKWFAGVVMRWYKPLAAGGFALFVLMTWGVAKTETTARLHDLFAHPDHRLLQDYAWLEQHIGPLVPIEVVLVLPYEGPENTLDRLQLVKRVGQTMEEVDGVDRAISAVTFLPPLPPPGRTGFRGTARRSLYAKLLQERRDRLAELRFLKRDGDKELWRISGRATASSHVEYGALLDSLDEKMQSQVLNAADARALQVDVVVTGSIPLIHRSQEQLLEDLFKSYLGAFAVIAIVMIVVLRSFTAGLLVMLPNLLPSVVVLGALGWAGISIEVGSIMTASAALGIAVDDTLHFVSWYRRALSSGQSRHSAIRSAYERCGPAMMQTSLICGLGLMVFAVSPFAPIARFAWLMGAMLVAAVAADLIVLPALLASPFGLAFTPSRRGKRGPAS